MKNIRMASTAIAVSLASCALFAEETAVKAQNSNNAAVATATTKQYASLAEARGKIGDVISDPSKTTEVMGGLSPEDQKAFLSDVNAAIAKLPGSVEDRTAKYLDVNRMALKSVASGSMADILAVTFATVPVESLTVLSECYAVNLFNRDAEVARGLSDAAYEQVAKLVVGKVEEATSGSDDAGVRNTLAILMFVRATGCPEDLSDKLVSTMPDSTTRELAKADWIPAAMAVGDKKSYDGMLAYADAGKSPQLNIVLNLAAPQVMEAIMVDMTSGMDTKAGVQTTPVSDQAFGGFDEAMVMVQVDTRDTSAGNMGEVPKSNDPSDPWNPSYKRTDRDLPHPTPFPQPTPEPEPKPYPYSTL